jgi:hypothetical protein
MLEREEHDLRHRGRNDADRQAEVKRLRGNAYERGCGNYRSANAQELPCSVVQGLHVLH